MTPSRQRRLLSVALICAALCAPAAAEDEEKTWQEAEVALPAFPKDGDLIEFYVSAATSNRFFVDAATLEVGKDDRVVRYSLVVMTAGGATNVTREGMRCDTRETKLYATGRSDRSWSPARVAEWRPIENKPINRHHAALFRDFFCPYGVAILNAEEGRYALRQGRHPGAP